MKRLQRLAAAAVLVGAAAPALASLITLETRHSTAAAASQGNATANGQYYRRVFEAAAATPGGAGYCDGTVLASLAGASNHGSCGGTTQNLAYGWFIDFELDAVQGADFSLRVAPDFGKGGAVFLDGKLLGSNNTDMWWGGNWGASGEIFQFVHRVLDEGPHRLAIYGLEGCCDGGQQAQFRIGADPWTTFSATDGLTLRAAPPAAVPEPASLALALAALAALAFPVGRRALRRRHG